MSRRPARPQPDRTNRRLRGDDGSVVLELALVAPIMVVMLLGIFEFGIVFRNQTIVVNATRSAARIESQNPSTLTVDELALQSFIAGTNGLKNMTLNKVVVFNAPTSGAVPSGCLTATITGTPPYGVTGSCNVYNLTQVLDIAVSAPSFASDFGCGGIGNSTGTTWDGKWCPGARSTTLTTTMTRVGVYASYTYTDVTNLFTTKTMTITSTAIFAIQPNV
jgi:Flp pilus assembly protein TadG